MIDSWQHALQALNSLSECSLKMRKPDDWYVSQKIEIKDTHVLKSVCGNGPNPEEAVWNHWRQITADLESHEYIIAREYWDGEVSKRLAVRWNGFMWDHVTEEKKAA